MTEQNARQRGLCYTGIYERSKEDLKPRLDAIRAKGYKAYIVTVPDSPYSRSACISRGYSVYVERKYILDEQAESTRQRLKVRHPAEREHLKKHYEQQIAELDARVKADEEWLAQNNYTL